MEEKALLAFDKLLQQIRTLPPYQVHAALSVCRELEDLPQDTVCWVCDVAMLTRKSEPARGLLEDLFELVDYKLQKQNSRELKRDALINLVRTLVFHHLNSYSFACEGNLAQFLGGIDEPAALDYYNKSVVGAVLDKLGQRIDIWKYAVRHLYKDRAQGHTIAPEFFQMNRAKRLPWIRHVLLNSTEIYQEPGRGRFGKPNLVYVGQTTVGADRPKYAQYFLVFVESNRSQKLGLLTAFHVDKYKDFMRLLADWIPRQVEPAHSPCA